MCSRVAAARPGCRRGRRSGSRRSGRRGDGPLRCSAARERRVSSVEPLSTNDHLGLGRRLMQRDEALARQVGPIEGRDAIDTREREWRRGTGYRPRHRHEHPSVEVPQERQAAGRCTRVVLRPEGARACNEGHPSAPRSSPGHGRSYAAGRNVSDWLRRELGPDRGEAIIEISYDLQAGSYTSLPGRERPGARAVCCRGGRVADPCLLAGDQVLDAGWWRGDHSLRVGRCARTPCRFLGLDLSWSRIRWARRNAQTAAHLVGSG